MNGRTIWTAAGLAAIGLALVALPGPSRMQQSQDETELARLEQKLAHLQERVRARLAGRQLEMAQQAQERAARETEVASQEVMRRPDDMEPGEQEAVTVLALDDEGTGWLGVEIQEVSADKAKELKLPAERGVMLSGITPDSPASKAGLKENDVVTEVNGQRVEGAVQFRRMIHEIPAGRTVQLTVWRDAHAQTVSVTLGKAEERHKIRTRVFPSGDFAFRMPEMPAIPNFEFYGELFPGGRPRLGIDAEDLSGQFGNFFGAPEGEGVLVRSVNSGSPAEKAGLKAGDVIIKFNNDRIRTVGDLREKLAAQREAKSVKLGVLRNHSEITLDVTIEPPASRKPLKTARRTNI